MSPHMPHFKSKNGDSLSKFSTQPRAKSASRKSKYPPLQQKTLAPGGCPFLFFQSAMSAHWRRFAGILGGLWTSGTLSAAAAFEGPGLAAGAVASGAGGEDAARVADWGPRHDDEEEPPSSAWPQLGADAKSAEPAAFGPVPSRGGSFRRIRGFDWCFASRSSALWPTKGADFSPRCKFQSLPSRACSTFSGPSNRSHKRR
mmetsp:Transcript_76057/g.211391  ORF Transcript_76057/g.211391 Transcript_76057/m.211391 type:complete len:201 (+) Transcript_76057:2005-2607(+)